MLFILLASVFGGMIVFVTPPFQAPDDHAHFYRAYQISEFKLLPENFDSIIGSELPTSLRTTVLLAGMEDLAFHPNTKAAPSRILTLFDILWIQQCDGSSPSNSSSYPPLMYLPQALEF